MKHYSCFIVVIAGALLAAVSCDSDSSVSSPAMTLTGYTLTIPYAGGDYGMGYSLSNERDDGVFNVELVEDEDSDEDAWVYDIDFSEADTIKFSVEARTERLSRKCSLSVTYTYGDSTVIERFLTIKQELNNYYSLDATCAAGVYYGTSNSETAEGTVQYSFYLSDADLLSDGSYAPGATYYVFDLWTETVPDDKDNVILPSGTYSAGTAEYAEEFDSEVSVYVLVNEDGSEYEEYYYLTGGSMTITNDSGTLTITASLTDSNGGEHEITYAGAFSLENESLLTSLEGDYDLGDFSGVDCVAEYYADYFETGTADWLLNIYGASQTGFMIDICADASYTFDGGELPVGEFTASTDGGTVGTFLAGRLAYRYLDGTWLVSLDENGSLAEPYAPIVTGTVTITKSDSEYTIEISGYDDDDNVITASWTGTPTLEDGVTTKAGARRSGLKL